MSSSVECQECGFSLSEVVNSEGSNQSPCPRCGGLGRTFSESTTERALAGNHVAGVHSRDGDAIGFVESPRDGISTGADTGPDETISARMIGRSPQGEEDTLQVCRRLIRSLNDLGAQWSDPVVGEQDEDGVASSADGSESLRMQVVRADSNQGFWSDVARLGTAEKVGTADAYSAELRAAIESKSKPDKIPLAQRDELVLVLDATRLPGHVLAAPVRRFRTLHGDWAAQLGFQSIWIVGPTLGLVWRLDQPPEDH